MNSKNIDPIHPELIRCVIAAEDKRFYHHYGIDTYALVRSIYKTVFLDKLEGGSTIEQQLTRIITNRREITLKRKLVEMMHAVRIGKKFTKEEIMSAYLWSYRLSKNKSLMDTLREEKYDLANLTDKNIIEIAARLKYPSIKAENYIKYLKRVRTIEIIAFK